MTSQSIYLGEFHTFTTNDATNTVHIQTDPGKTLELEGRISATSLAKNRALGSYYFSSGGTTIITVNTWTKIAGITLPGPLMYNFVSNVNNRIQYKGNVKGIFCVNGTIGLDGTNADVCLVGFAKNGTIMPNTQGVIYLDSYQTSLIGHVELEYNDYIEMFVYNASASNNILTNGINLTITGIF